jgi:putative membrane protein
MIFLIMNIASVVRAHEGGAIPEDVWTHWNTNLLTLIGVLLPIYLYLRGAATYRVGWTRKFVFFGGMAALFAALISPIDAMGGSLFAGHMIQHLLLVQVAAPLLMLSHPNAALLRGLPNGWRKSVGQTAYSITQRKWWRGMTNPVVVSGLHIVAIGVWHIPILYSAAIHNPVLHVLEHVSFFGTALLYWWMLHEVGEYGVRVLSVFVVMMTSGLLGALMTFANGAWYLDHTAYVGAWGLTPLEDQQLAGLLMWIPSGVVYVMAAGFLLSAWINAVERRVTERERRLAREFSDV